MAQKDAAQKDAAQKAREGSIEHWIEYYQTERRKPPVPSEEPHSSEPSPVKPGEPQVPTPAKAGQK